MFRDYEEAIAHRQRMSERYRVLRDDQHYAAARREHAWRLRHEGATFAEIGNQIDVTRERARQIVLKFERLGK